MPLLRQAIAAASTQAQAQPAPQPQTKTTKAKTKRNAKSKLTLSEQSAEQPDQSAQPPNQSKSAKVAKEVKPKKARKSPKSDKSSPSPEPSPDGDLALFDGSFPIEELADDMEAPDSFMIDSSAIESIDDPVERHAFLHEFCLSVLPSQSRAVSLLLYLFKAEDKRGVSLFDVLRYQRLPPRPITSDASPNAKIVKSTASGDGTNYSFTPTQLTKLIEAAKAPGSNPSDAATAPAAATVTAAADTTIPPLAFIPPKDRHVHPEKRLELRALYAKVEAQTTADLLLHNARLKADAAALAQKRQANAARGVHYMKNQDHWMRLDDDVVQNQCTKTPVDAAHLDTATEPNESEFGAAVNPFKGKVPLLSTTRIDAQLFRASLHHILLKERDAAVLAADRAHDLAQLAQLSVNGELTESHLDAAVTSGVKKGRPGLMRENLFGQPESEGGVLLSSAQQSRRLNTFLSECMRVLGTSMMRFHVPLAQHFNALTTTEFEKVRLSHPEAESHPYVAFRVNHHEAASHKNENDATAVATADTTATAAEATSSNSLAVTSTSIPEPTPLPAFGTAWSTSKALPQWSRRNTSPTITSTLPVTVAPRSVSFGTQTYVDQWRTSFGASGSFDAFPMTVADTPSVSFANDAHSRTAREWCAPYDDDEGAVHRKLFVRNLHPETSVAELIRAFEPFGRVLGGEIHREELVDDINHHQALHMLDTNSKPGGKLSARDAKRRVLGDKAKSSVHAFLYFEEEESVTRATTHALRLFGIHVKGFTAFPEPASEKDTLSLTLPRAMRTPKRATTLDIENMESVNSLLDPLGESVRPHFSALYLEAAANKHDTDLSRWNDVQAILTGALASAGIDPSVVESNSRRQLGDSGRLSFACLSHGVASRLYRELVGRVLPNGMQPIVAWAPSRPQRFDLRQVHYEQQQAQQRLIAEQEARAKELGDLPDFDDIDHFDDAADHIASENIAPPAAQPDAETTAESSAEAVPETHESITFAAATTETTESEPLEQRDHGLQQLHL